MPLTRRHLRPASSWRVRLAWLGFLWSQILGILAAQAVETGKSKAAEAQRESGQAALQASDFVAAEKAFTASYRLDPQPELLYLLGKLALAQGRLVEAQDFMRRYLADPDHPTEDAMGSEAQRVVDSDPGAQESGEVNVIGPRGSLLRDGERVLAVLPLFCPLLLSSGPHTLVLEQGSRVLSGQVDVVSGRNLEARFNLDGRAVLVSLPPSIVYFPEAGAAETGAPRSLFLALEQEVRRARYAVISRKSALLRAPATASCLSERRCIGELLSKNEAEALLQARITASPAQKDMDYEVELDLIDAQVLLSAANERLRCAACTLPQATAQLSTAVAKLLERGRARARGTLALDSSPSGAMVFLNGQQMGTTPYERPVFAGDQRLELRLQGYENRLLELRVEKGEVVSRTVALEQAALKAAPAALLPAAPRPADRRRSRLPLWLGLGLAGAGVLLGGFGISALSVSQSCSPETPPTALHCRDYYDSTPTGGALLGVGLGLVVGGAIAVAVYARR